MPLFNKLTLLKYLTLVYLLLIFTSFIIKVIIKLKSTLKLLLLLRQVIYTLT